MKDKKLNRFWFKQILFLVGGIIAALLGITYYIVIPLLLMSGYIKF